jgi:hypothetical protein
VSFRVPDPTNENNNDPQRSLDLIALAIDSAGNANGNSLNITVRHTATQRHGVDMTAADTIGNNGTDLELFFLQPPTGTRVGIHTIARTAAAAAYIPEASQVGVSLYEAEYRGIGTSTFFNEGSAAQVSFYFLSAPEDPFLAVISAAGGPAALNLPAYVGGPTANVYNLIADVQGSPYRATFTLPPARAIVALVFNEFGHTIPLDRAARVNSGPIFQVRALDCPAGPYSISTPTPLDGTYSVQILNNGLPADRFEFLYQRTGMAAPARLHTPPGPPGAPLATQLIPATGIVQAGPDPATGGPNTGFHGGRASFFDPNIYAPPRFGAGTYTQFLRVFEDTNGNGGFDPGEPEAFLNLCPTFQVTN